MTRERGREAPVPASGARPSSFGTARRNEPERVSLCLGLPKAQSMPESERTGPPEDAPEVPSASACETRPGRTLIVEDGNHEGWLAADLSVDLEEWC